MFFAIIPTVVYEVLGAQAALLADLGPHPHPHPHPNPNPNPNPDPNQAALLADCSAASYGRSGAVRVRVRVRVRVSVRVSCRLRLARRVSQGVPREASGVRRIARPAAPSPLRS